MASFDYSGKTALITGASSGIGLTFAEQLAARYGADFGGAQRR
jgi:NAD(P)-dependent dehydrogenase (short-subunit alcohol dehydrogenase family)